MPYYEYRCQACHSRFELMRSMAQRDDPGRCPECEGEQISRMLSMPATFSMSSDGNMVPIGTSPSACGSCTATSCGSCSVN
ncbi:MAG: zinc ribbon domain-containing protein [Anaerolineales bacterium]|uniref:Zinc ribbon domain-containing protein n=1 Tax=Candidatus Desulfolinea nitratireducens TaxID=2841698 RepID=A0A8J6NI69_9CHLR|nr:zinc ribbon domain-containing protein [Candidatus Desulfolinea nitratireducens]